MRRRTSARLSDDKLACYRYADLLDGAAIPHNVRMNTETLLQFLHNISRNSEVQIHEFATQAVAVYMADTTADRRMTWNICWIMHAQWPFSCLHHSAGVYSLVRAKCVKLSQTKWTGPSVGCKDHLQASLTRGVYLKVCFSNAFGSWNLHRSYEQTIAIVTRYQLSSTDFWYVWEESQGHQVLFYHRLAEKRG